MARQNKKSIIKDLKSEGIFSPEMEDLTEAKLLKILEKHIEGEIAKNPSKDKKSSIVKVSLIVDTVFCDGFLRHKRDGSFRTSKKNFNSKTMKIIKELG